MVGWLVGWLVGWVVVGCWLVVQPFCWWIITENNPNDNPVQIRGFLRKGGEPQNIHHQSTFDLLELTPDMAKWRSSCVNFCYNTQNPSLA